MIVQRLQSISAFFLDDEAKQSQTLKAISSAEPDTGCPKKNDYQNAADGSVCCHDQSLIMFFFSSIRLLHSISQFFGTPCRCAYLETSKIAPSCSYHCVPYFLSALTIKHYMQACLKMFKQCKPCVQSVLPPSLVVFFTLTCADSVASDKLQVWTNDWPKLTCNMSTEKRMPRSTEPAVGLQSTRGRVMWLQCCCCCCYSFLFWKSYRVIYLPALPPPLVQYQN